MGCKGKRTMSVHPTIGFGFTPGGLTINAREPFGDDALSLLFLMPKRAFGSVHHLVGADGVVIAQVQEIAEK